MSIFNIALQGQSFMMGKMPPFLTDRLSKANTMKEGREVFEKLEAECSKILRTRRRRSGAEDIACQLPGEESVEYDRQKPLSGQSTETLEYIRNNSRKLYTEAIKSAMHDIGS